MDKGWEITSQPSMPLERFAISSTLGAIFQGIALVLHGTLVTTSRTAVHEAARLIFPCASRCTPPISTPAMEGVAVESRPHKQPVESDARDGKAGEPIGNGIRARKAKKWSGMT